MFGTKVPAMALVEGQIGELRDQVREERDSRLAANKAATERAERVDRQHEETTEMFARLMEKHSGLEGQKEQNEQA